MKARLAIISTLLFLSALMFLTGALWQQQRAPELPVSEAVLEHTIQAMEVARNAHADSARQFDDWREYTQEAYDMGTPPPPNVYWWVKEANQDAKWVEIYDNALLILEYVRRINNEAQKG